MSYKMALAQTAATTPGLNSPGQILAVRNAVSAAASGVAAPCYHAKNATDVRVQTGYQYWVTCQRVTKNLDRWHSSLDGLSVSGEHTVPFLHYLPRIGRMSCRLQVATRQNPPARKSILNASGTRKQKLNALYSRAAAASACYIRNPY